MRSEVCATVRIPAFHSWPDAPDDVAYLRHQHRHLLTVRVWMPVSHGDRDIEFHQLQRAVRVLLLALLPHPAQPGELQLGNRSCEHVAQLLVSHCSELGGMPNRVEVWEDDENGAILHPTEHKAI